MGMSGLYVGMSGLQASSNSLNTTANNLANVNTTGYVRQQVVYKDQQYTYVTTTSGTNTGQRGLGVSIATINHVRDIFLDAAYRKENGRQNFYEKLSDATTEIQTQFGEVDGIAGIGFQDKMADLLESLNEIAKTPSDSTARAGLAQSAVAFIDASKSIYEGLVNYQKTLNTEVETTVDRINTIGESLLQLNRQIAKIETAGTETASDLRDQRDLLLDELSSYCKISYKEDDTGSVEVLVEGVQFVDNLNVNYMGTALIEGTDLVNPVWPAMESQSVYNLGTTISTSTNTDVGGLKGLLVARGSVTPTYANMTAPDAADYAGGSTDPDYLSALNLYNLYTTSSQTSTLVNTIANFDKLINGIVENINDILCPETTYTALDGTVYTVLDTDNASTAADGTYGVELFKRDYCDRYTEQVIDGETFYVRNDKNTFGNTSTYSIMNVTVNDDILQDYSMLPLTTAAGEEDYTKAGALVSIFSKDLMTYNDGLNEMTFEEFLQTLTGDIANSGSIYESMAENEASLSESLDSERQAIMGVSSDEELANMIKYQQAYNAASRYINVVSDMLETLINNTGSR